MRLFTFFAAALVSTALAYNVTVPNAQMGWTNKGTQPLSWVRVDTDQPNFAAILVNQQRTGFKPAVMEQSIDGGLGQTVCHPPDGGWPEGTGFQVNLVRNASQPEAILAQSEVFTISKANATSTNGTADTTGTATQPTNTATESAKSAAISVSSVNSGLILTVLALAGTILA